LKIDVENIPYSGAAGGLGAGLYAFLKAKLESGFAIVNKYTRLTEKIKKSNLVITGEGEMDFQTEFGKVPFEVAKIAKENEIPVFSIVGNLRITHCGFNQHFEKIYSLTSVKISKEDAMKNAEKYLIEVSKEAAMYLKTHPMRLRRTKTQSLLRREGNNKE